MTPTRTARRRCLGVVGLTFLVVVLAIAATTWARAPTSGNGRVPDSQAQVPPPPTASGGFPGTTPSPLPAPAEPRQIVFGTLGSDASKAATESAAGVKGATLELSWSDYEPSPGEFSAAYVSRVRARMTAFRAAGQQLTLALGIHDNPGWVRSLPDAIAVDQHGARSPGIDMVFSQPVRDAAAAYLARMNLDLGITNFAYIRLTSGGSGEMLYNTGGSYAAFSAAAQNGANLAAGMPRNPLPGWRPGDRSVRPEQVQQWADWYVNGLVDVTRWQIRQFDRLGFHGTYQTVTPGSGVRPDGYAIAVRDFLPDGLVGIGGVWERYYSSLHGQPRLMTYTSSVADGSGKDDHCLASDRAVDVAGAQADTWSATRWQRRLALEHGFSNGGENPGYGDGNAKNPHYADTSERGMLASALRQAQSCGFEVFNFAHDDQLWQGPASFAAYAAAIRAYHGTQPR